MPPAPLRRPPRRGSVASLCASWSRTSRASTSPTPIRPRRCSSSGLDSLTLTQVALQVQKHLRRQGHLPPADGALPDAASAGRRCSTRRCRPTRQPAAAPPTAAAGRPASAALGDAASAVPAPAASATAYVRQVIAQQMQIDGAAARPARRRRRRRPAMRRRCCRAAAHRRSCRRSRRGRRTTTSRRPGRRPTTSRRRSAPSPASTPRATS